MHRSPRAHRVSFALAATLSVALPSTAVADALFVGPEFQINTYTTGMQERDAGRGVARSADGRFVVVWVSRDQDGDGDGVFGQRFDSSGNADGTEFQVNTYTTSFQIDPDVASTPDGRFVVVWTSFGDGDSLGVFGRRYDSAGSPQGADFPVNAYTTGAQVFPAVAAADDGSFVVTWWGNNGGDDIGVSGQRFDSSGSPDGTEFVVNTYTTSTQGYPAVSGPGDGSFVVLWNSSGQDGDAIGVFGQRFDSSGNPDGTEFAVNSYTTGLQLLADVSSADDGGFVAVWTGSNGLDGDSSGVFGQRFDGAGSPSGTEFQANTYTTGVQSYGAVATDADGSFLVVWSSDAGQDGSGKSAHAQRYDATGAKDGAEFQVNTYTTGDQFRSISAASDGVGSFVVAWNSYGQDGDDTGMFGQLLCTDADGSGGCEARCSRVPRGGCTVAAQAKLDINEKSAGKEKMKLQWKKLADATVQGDFGDPVGGTTAAALCIYDDADALVQQYVVDRAGDTCAGKDCWKAKGTKGYAYKDKESSADGVSKIGYGSGDPGKGKADAGGKNNAAKGQTSLPTGVVAKLTSNTAPTIQMVTSDGFCATATMSEVKKDEAARYSAQLK